jgi:hypothetical protein
MKLPSFSFSFSLLYLLSETLHFRVGACGHHHGSDHHHLRRLANADTSDDDEEDVELPACGAEETSSEQRLVEAKLMSKWKTRHYNRDLLQTNYEIPLYFHVIRDDDGNGDVSDSLLSRNLDYLNEGFAATAFSFRLVKTNRINSSTWNKCSYANNRDAKKAHNLGGVASVNIYFCDIQNGSGGWSYVSYFNS